MSQYGRTTGREKLVYTGRSLCGASPISPIQPRHRLLLWCTAAEQPNMRLGSWSFKYFPAPRICGSVDPWIQQLQHVPKTLFMWMADDPLRPNHLLPSDLCLIVIDMLAPNSRYIRKDDLRISQSFHFQRVSQYSILGGYSWGNGLGTNVESWNRKYLFSHES